MKFLSIDTSTKYSVIAIFDENGLFFSESRLFEMGRLDGIDVLIRAAFKKTKLDISEIGGFGVGVGPGSFTGIRIGISTIKGLSYSLNKPVYGFSSLDAIAYAAFGRGARFSRLCVLVDARRLNVYSCLYKRTGNIERLTEDELLSFDNFLSRSYKDTVFCGDGVEVYKEKLLKKFSKSSILPKRAWFPTPESISLLTLQSFKEGKGKNSFELSAKYLYEQDCQVKKIKG